MLTHCDKTEAKKPEMIGLPIQDEIEYMAQEHYYHDICAHNCEYRGDPRCRISICMMYGAGHSITALGANGTTIDSASTGAVVRTAQ